MIRKKLKWISDISPDDSEQAKTDTMTKILRIKYIDGKRIFTLLPTGKNSELSDLKKWEHFNNTQIAFNTNPVDGVELKKGDVIIQYKYGSNYYYKVVKITNHKIVVGFLHPRFIYEYGRYIAFHDEIVPMYRVEKIDDIELKDDEYRKIMFNKKDTFHKVFDKSKMYDARHLYLD